MPDLRLNRATLARFSGLALGIVLGGVLGPICSALSAWARLRPCQQDASLGALVGYLLVSLGLLIARYRQDAELRRAAEAVKAELGLQKTIGIKIKDGRATLEGEVERDSNGTKPSGPSPPFPASSR